MNAGSIPIGRAVTTVVERSTGEPAPFIGLERIESHTGRLSTDVLPEKEATDSLTFKPGDVLFGKLRPYLAKSVLSSCAGTGSGELLVLRPGPKTDSRFLHYVTLSRGWLDWADLHSYGSKMPRTTWDAMRLYRIPSIGPAEQRAIADFLDRETAQIDAMVDAQERLVALLEERTRALLAHAVTGQLDEVSGIKPSGLRWAGHVPEHWEVGNIRRYASMKTGHTPSRQRTEYWEDCTIPWFTLADVWQLRQGRTHVAETSQQISKLGLANSAAELLPIGTVMLSRTASVAFSGIMTKPMATSQDYWNWVCGPALLPEYLLYSFRAMFDDLRSLTAGSTHKTIYEADAAALRIVVPPMDEQRRIVQYLTAHLAQMNTIVAKAQESIALMKERRAALISAAVTGRIDVHTGAQHVERELEEAMA